MACSMHVKDELCLKFWLVRQKVRYSLEDLDVDERMILKLNSNIL
jgi:hypothetical protein